MATPGPRAPSGERRREAPAARRGAPRGARGPPGPRGPLADVLYKAEGGGYRVRLAAFSGGGRRETAEGLAALAALAAGGGDGGPGAPARAEAPADPGGPPRPPPGDLLRAAAASGATANLAFLDILDGGDFEPAPCLCCYRAETLQGARKAALELGLFQRYYDPGSYLGSKAFPRMVRTLGRDALPEELAAVKGHLSRLRQTTDLIRAVNAHPGICVTAPPCRPGTVWLYSTPTGRKMLRHLSRRFRAGGSSLSVGVASSDPEAHPRWRYRMYAVTLRREGAGPDPAGALLGAMRDWVAEATLPPAPPPGRGAPRGARPPRGR